MEPLSHHLLTQAYNNGWANHRLYKACLQLTQDEFVAPRCSFFPSIKATLNHLLTVDWFYRFDHHNPAVRGFPYPSTSKCHHLK